MLNSDFGCNLTADSPASFRKRFGSLLAACLAVMSVTTACPAATLSERPNVVLILTDDQGYGDIAFHGNDRIDTPVLDRLATESTRLNRFMVCPLCSMTRATLLTGRYNLRTGCASVTRGIESVRPNEVLISEVLKTAGYATGCFGKWHIGENYPSHPRGQGFDEFFGMPQGHWDNYFDPLLEHNGKMVQTKGYISDVLTDAAMSFIGEHHDRPFFCYLAYNAPHTPMQIADRYYDKYASRGLDAKPAAIYGMVQNIDENVGRLLEQLDELSIAENTIVIFLSDNGAEGPEGSRFNAGMRGMKGSVHEGGVRVPMFVRWPGRIEANRSLDQLTAHVDLLPTIAELCRIKDLKTKPLDGRSLAPLLLGQDVLWPSDRLVFARNPGWKHLVGALGQPIIESVNRPFPGSVRTQRWRAVNESDRWDLYDMQADPGQTKNVAADHPDVVQRLSHAYTDWFADVTSVPIARPVIDIGHRRWPVVKLAVPEAHFSGDIHWFNQWGFAHDWLTGWSKLADKIWWEANVVNAGRYEVVLKYACEHDAVGTKLRVTAGDSTVEGVLRKSHPPNPVQRPTRIDKKRFVQTFATQSLGVIELLPGRTRLTLEAIGIPGERVCDVHSLILQSPHSPADTVRAKPGEQPSGRRESDDRPDVVLIMADDMGYSDLGCFGGEIETPSLDSLAADGLRFTNFYSENMCWVSRAALLTGIYHKTSLKDDAIHPRCLTLGEALLADGYQTRMSGKWHLAGKDSSVYPLDRGFEHFYGILGGAASFFAPYSLSRDRTGIKQEYENEDYYFTHAVTDNAVSYVEKADPGKPLFLYVAYTAAHWPLHALPADIDHYRGKYAVGWDVVRERRLAKMKDLGVVDSDAKMSPRHPDVPAWADEPNQPWQQRRMEVYAAQVTAMDTGIGKLIAALKRAGRLDNTLLLFMVDNGACHVEYGENRKGYYLPQKTRDGRPVVPGNRPDIMPGPEDTYQSYGYGWANASNTPQRLFKQFDHEGGIHTPMIAHWPREIASPGGIVQQVSHLIDVMPLVLEATKTDLPKLVRQRRRIQMDGISLLPALRGVSQPGHETLFFDHAKGKALRHGRWKLVKVAKNDWELYDIRSDPNELNDLAVARPDKVRQLAKRWAEWSDRQTERSHDSAANPHPDTRAK